MSTCPAACHARVLTLQPTNQPTARWHRRLPCPLSQVVLRVGNFITGTYLEEDDVVSAQAAQQNGGDYYVYEVGRAAQLESERWRESRIVPHAWCPCKQQLHHKSCAKDAGTSAAPQVATPYASVPGHSLAAFTTKASSGLLIVPWLCPDA